MEPAKEEAVATTIAAKDSDKTAQEEASVSKDEKERTPSPLLKADPNESEVVKELKVKLK